MNGRCFQFLLKSSYQILGFTFRSVIYFELNSMQCEACIKEHIYIFLEKTILSSLNCHLGLCMVVYELLPVPLICVYLPGPHSLDDCSSMVLHGSDGSLEDSQGFCLFLPCTLMSCVPWCGAWCLLSEQCFVPFGHLLTKEVSWREHA